MTQFKDKSKQHPEYVNAGLFNYPVLMAADILLYKTDGVPIGKDQQQHVELTRAVCRYFNGNFGNILKEPKDILSEGQKIMSLTEPDKKMSKTGNHKGCIGLFEDPESIKKKIASAVTDTGREIIFDPRKKPGIANLLTIMSLVSQKPVNQLEKEFDGKNYSEFKKNVALSLVDYLEPLRRKQSELSVRDVYVADILKRGAAKAQIIASETMREVKTAMGLAA